MTLTRAFGKEMTHVSQAETLPALPGLPPGMPAQGCWTYEDYCRIPDDGKRYEVIRGILYMSPAPLTRHQRSLGYLYRSLCNHVDASGSGEVFLSPIDVILPELATPCQPDILFVARDRAHIVERKYLWGSPDLTVEILSPSNRSHDRKTKFEVYAEAGVKEYWIVDLDAREIEVFTLAKGEYRLHGRFGAGDMARSKLLEGFEASVAKACPVE